MRNLKKLSGVQFFEDYILPTNGQTKNKLWEVTLLPFAARHTGWLSLGAGIRHSGFVNGCRQRIISAIAKGGVHAIAAAQCFAIGAIAAQGSDVEMLAQAGVGALFNAYCIAIQADVGMRCFKVLESGRNRHAESTQHRRRKSFRQPPG